MLLPIGCCRSRNVLLPIAHSVPLGAGAACGRWAVKGALGAALARAAQAAAAQVGAAVPFAEAHALQADVAVAWERRCATSAHAAGVCELRGMLTDGEAPASAQNVRASAGYALAGAGHAVRGGARWFSSRGAC